MNSSSIKGTAIATAIASLCAMGIASVGHAADKAGVKCEGSNSCKGTGGCKTAKNECKGQNACKGQGWTMEKDKAACEKKGGKVGG